MVILTATNLFLRLLTNTQTTGKIDQLLHNNHQTDLTKIHDNTLVYFLPQVSSEDLDEGDLQSWDLAVHKDSCQIQLHLETYIHLEHR